MADWLSDERPRRRALASWLIFFLVKRGDPDNACERFAVGSGRELTNLRFYITALFMRALKVNPVVCRFVMPDCWTHRSLSVQDGHEPTGLIGQKEFRDFNSELTSLIDVL